MSKEPQGRDIRVTVRYGGTRLVGRRYHLGRRPVEILTGWGPGARIRNVRIRFLDDHSETVRPFRGLRIKPRGANPGRHDRM